MSQRALISVMVLFCLKIVQVHAQVPDLDALATVSPATGEMQFALPLGAIPGYSANLGYKAGIQVNEPASAAGLGFSYEAGSITRKIIFVPDDNTGTNRSFDERQLDEDCDIDNAVWIRTIGRIIYTIILSIITGPSSGALLPAIISDVVQIVQASTKLAGMAQVEFHSKDFFAGGKHSIAYTPVGGKNDIVYGQGYLYGGAQQDLPDVYFINTPYLSGMMYPKGGKDNNNKVQFVIAQKDGSPNNNAIITYDVVREEFEITLEDGTKVYLGGTTNTIRRNSVSTSRVYVSSAPDGSPNEISCYDFKKTEQRQDVPTEWLIRKVLSPDYVDGDNDTEKDPLTSPETNKGGWVAFTYEKDGPVNARRLPYATQAMPNGFHSSATIISYPGRDRDADIAGDVDSYVLNDIYLRAVQTPTGKVTYNYTYGRKDDLWLRTGDYNWNWCLPNPPNTSCAALGAPADQIRAIRDNEPPVARRVLDNIVFYNNNLQKTRTVKLHTSYTLRRNTFYSKVKTTSGAWANYADNGACLTLDGIEVLDRNDAKPLSIKFRYNFNPSLSSNSGYTVPGGPYGVSYQVEDRDLWGYYFAKPASIVNDFNEIGEYTKAVQGGITQASAWSLSSIVFPTGKQISWEYEPHRYDRCNGEPLGTTSSTGPRFGGGIRVKSVSVMDQSAGGKQQVYSYFYTDSDGSFVETSNNGSGHATVEPYPYLLLDDDDPRAEIARGGLYTPVKVCYEKVKIVNGYIPPSTQHPEGQTPFGFNVYDYYTSADFKNRGRYGEFDESWKRGFQKRAAQFNANNKCIAEKVQAFEWYSNSWFVSTSQANLTEHAEHIGCGTVRLVSAEQKTNGVKQITNQYYADQCTGTGTDKVAVNSKAYGYTLVPYTIPTDQNDLIDCAGKSGNFIGSAAPEAIAVLHHRIYQGSTSAPLLDKLELVVCWDIHADPRNPSTPVNQQIITVVTVTDPTRHFAEWKLYIDPKTDGTADIYLTYRYSLADPLTVKKVPGLRINNLGNLEHGAITTVSAAQGTNYNEKIVMLDPTNGLVVRWDYDYFGDRDGKPNKVSTANSDGKKLIKEMIPAFTQPAYSEMLTKNILTPVCQSTTYGQASGSSAVPYVVAAQAITWSKTLGTNTWVSNKSYVWKADYQSDGTPDKTFANFDHTAGAANANWKLTGSADKYTANSQVKEVSSPTSGGGSLPSATVYGYNGTLPIASITGATWDECAVFTGDYQCTKEASSYWDYENGWEKGSAETNRPAPLLADNVTHFGHRVLAVTNNYAAGRNNRVYPGKAYVMSAWVKVTDGTLFMAAGYLSRNASSTNPWPIPGGTLQSTGLSADMVSMSAADCGGKWKLMKLVIPASKTALMTDASKEYYARAWVGNHGDFGNTDGVTAYIDDIRFSPAKAMVTTTYYHPIWLQPIMGVDVNCKPGVRTYYDNYGRPIRSAKIDPTKTANETGFATALKETEYHYRHELAATEKLKVLYPDGTNVFHTGDRVVISWLQKNSGNITIVSSNADNSSPVSIQTAVSTPAGQHEINWDIPDNAGGLNKIITITHSVDGSFSSARTFTIKTPPAKPTYVFPSTDGFDQMPTSGASLSWSCSDRDGDVLSYDVYIKRSGDPNFTITTTNNTTFPLGTLDARTVYQWKVVAKDQRNVVDGDLWQFSTFEGLKKVLITGDRLGNQIPCTSYPGSSDCYEHIPGTPVVDNYYSPGEVVTVDLNSTAVSIDNLYCWRIIPRGWFRKVTGWQINVGPSIPINFDQSSRVMSFTVPTGSYSNIEIEALYGSCQAAP